MHIKLKTRHNKSFFYLVRSRRAGQKIHQHEIYLGPSLELASDKWMLVINKSKEGFAPINVHDLWKKVDEYVRKNGLPPSSLAGLYDAQREHAKLMFGVNAYRRVLNVGPDATPAQIKSAFRRKSFAAHPDHGGSREAIQRLINARDSLLRLAPTTGLGDAKTAS